MNWSGMFDGLDVNQAVIDRHIPNREISCYDRDAPRITDDVDKAIKRKHRVSVVC